VPIKKQIGTYHVKDGETRTKNFEVAAWYQELKVIPGDYPVHAMFEDGKALDTSVTWQIPGTITSSCFDSLYGGFPVTGNRNRDVGQHTTYSSFTYAHALAKAILEKKEDLPFTLLPGFEAREIPFTYDDKACVTYGIFEVGA
jgi:hypothetical protein